MIIKTMQTFTNVKIFQNDRTNFLTIQLLEILIQFYKTSFAECLIVLDNKTIIEKISV